MKIGIKQWLGWLLIIFAVCLGCATPEGVASKSPTGKILVELSKSSIERSLTPDMNLEVYSYDIIGQGPSGASFQILDFKGSSYSSGDIPFGLWLITASGKNEQGTIIEAGTESVELKTSETQSVNILCVPITGKGTISLSLSLPASQI